MAGQDEHLQLRELQLADYHKGATREHPRMRCMRCDPMAAVEAMAMQLTQLNPDEHVPACMCSDLDAQGIFSCWDSSQQWATCRSSSLKVQTYRAAGRHMEIQFGRSKHGIRQQLVADSYNTCIWGCGD